MPSTFLLPTEYRPDIDGLRALAVLSVLIYHLCASCLPGGFVGVDIFFVISGFVVSGSLAHAPTNSFPRFVAFFYARRLTRIAPALLGVLFFTVLLSTLLVPRAWLSEFSERTARYAFFGLSNWVMQTNADTYFAPRAEFNPYTHTWSLGVEEQFYLAFPFLFFAWAVSGRRAGLHHIASLALGLLGLAALANAVYSTGATPTEAFYSIFSRFWELAVGVLLYQLSADRAARAVPGPLRRLARYLPWLGLGLIVISLIWVDATHFPWFWALPPVLGTALLIGGAGAGAHPVRHMLARKLPVWIGKRSYSLYLWHWPVFVLLRWTWGLESLLTRGVALGMALALTLLSYRWIEQPIRHSARFARRPAWQRIVVLVLALLLGWKLCTYMLAAHDRLNLGVVARQAALWYDTDRMPPGLLAPVASTRHCEPEFGYRNLEGGLVIGYAPQHCEAALPGTGRQLFVVGDSHATAYMPMLDQLSAEMGVNVNIYTYPSCPFLDFRLSNRHRGAGCQQFTLAAASDIRQQAHPGDIVFLASLRQPRFSDQWTRFDEKQVLANEASAFAQQFRDEAAQEAGPLLQGFTDAGLQVLLDAPKPVFRSPTFRCVDWFTRANPVCAGGLTLQRDQALALREPVLTTMQALAAQRPNVRIWDAFPLLCPGATCSAMLDNKPLFFDGDHVSAYGNAYLFPAFRAQVRSLWDGP